MDPAPGSRQDLVRNAVLFLQDPKVQSSPLQQRLEFLQNKGLTEPEIQQALAEAANPSQTTTTSTTTTSGPAVAPPAYARGQQPGMGGGGQQQAYYGFGQVYAPPEPPKRDWRDVFIMAVVSGGVVYGLTALARKYLVPHLKPPTSTTFQDTSAELSTQYDQAQAALDELRAETAALATAAESERVRVASALEDVESAARAVRDAESRWRDDMREVRGEVESVRELVPRMIEKHAGAQSAALAELQNELRSLKTLLVARQGAAASVEVAAAVPGPAVGTVPSGTASPTPSGTTATQAAANALLAPRGKASIPAWQLAAAPANGSGASAASASGVTSTAASTNASASASGASSPTRPTH